MSSITSRLVLGSSCAITAGIVIYVHIKQQTDSYKLDIDKKFRQSTSMIYFNECREGERNLPKLYPVKIPNLPFHIQNRCDILYAYTLPSKRLEAAREKMHEGVIRDMEWQQKRKMENLYILEKQNELAKAMKREIN